MKLLRWLDNLLLPDLSIDEMESLVSSIAIKDEIRDNSKSIKATYRTRYKARAQNYKKESRSFLLKLIIIKFGLKVYITMTHKEIFQVKEDIV